MTAGIVAPSDPRETAIAFDGDDLSACAQDDRGVLLDAANEIA
jgi:hypothetical protein